MKTVHKIKHLQDCRCLLKIEVQREEIDTAYERMFKHIQREASLPGFRKGKAPLDLIKKDYKEYAGKKVLEVLLEDSYVSTMEEAGLLPIGLPKIENVSFQEDKNLSFDAIVETRPEVHLKDYKGLKIKRKDAQIKDEDVNNALENLRQFHAQYKTIPPRPAQEGDFLLCDLEWIVDGEPVEKKENVILPVEKKTLTGDMFGGILGSNVGEKRPISVNIDKNFPKQEYIGKSAILEVLVHQIKQKELPQLDDEFAKDLGQFEGMKDLREKIEGQLNIQRQRDSRIDMENQVIDQLLKMHSFQLPHSLVEAEFKSLMEDARQKLLNQGHSEENVREVMEKEKGSLDEKLKGHAEKQVKIFFILDEIAKKENLCADEKEVDEFIQELAKRQEQKDAARFKEQLKKDKKIDGFYWQLTEAKTMDFLLDNARVESPAAA